MGRNVSETIADADRTLSVGGLTYKVMKGQPVPKRLLRAYRDAIGAPNPEPSTAAEAPSTALDALEALQTENATLKARVDELEAALPVAAEITKRLDALDTKVAEIPATGDLVERLDVVEARVAEIPATGDGNTGSTPAPKPKRSPSGKAPANG